VPGIVLMRIRGGCDWGLRLTCVLASLAGVVAASPRFSKEWATASRRMIAYSLPAPPIHKDASRSKEQALDPTAISSGTAITLTVSPVTGVAAGTPLTLTASVKDSARTPVTPGTVNFYDDASNPNLIGTAQLNASGISWVRVLLPAAIHHITAAFQGTPAHPASGSLLRTVVVSRVEVVRTITALTASGNPGNDVLNANLASFGSAVPAGNLSFLDNSKNDTTKNDASKNDTRNNETSNNNSMLASLGLGPASQGFAAHADFGSSSSATDCASGDFDGDGTMDLACVNSNSGLITIFLGDGAGNFAAGTAISTGHTATAIVVGDFNNDGALDLATAGAGGIDVIPGNGNGSFRVPLAITTLAGAVQLAAGDFNQDGNLDLAVTSSNGQTAILYGKGNGSFSDPATVYASQSAGGIIAADLDHDGSLDLVIADPLAGSISILHGNGNGQFQFEESYSVAAGLAKLSASDLNGDGNLDLAIPNPGSNTVTTLLGNGDGSFQAPTVVLVGASPQAAAFGDFNGDGKPDLAVVNAGDSTISMLAGNGDGTFQPQEILSTGTGPQWITAADLNAEGYPDLITAGSTSISTLLGARIQTATLGPISLFGGTTHLVVATYVPATGESYNKSFSQPVEIVSTYLRFTVFPAASISKPANPGNVQVTIYSNRGVMTASAQAVQLVVTGPGKYSRIYSQEAASGVATFTAFDPLTAPGTYTYTANFPNGTSDSAITATEVVNGAPQPPAIRMIQPETGSGSTVTVLSVTPASPITDGTVVTLQATVTDQFTSPVNPGTVNFFDSSMTPTQVGTAQLTTAGIASIKLRPGVGSHSFTAKYMGNGTATASASSAVALTVTSPSTTYATTMTIAQTGNAASYALTGTVAVPGVATPTGTVSFIDTSNSNAVLATGSLGTATSGFASYVSYGTGSYPYGIAVADFNHDGFPDLVATNTGATTVSFFKGNGDGTLQGQLLSTVLSGPYGVAAGDFNGDGNLDLAVTSYNSTVVTILLGDGTGIFTTKGSYTVGTGPIGVAVGDFNGDGILDLAVAVYGSGTGTTISVLKGVGDGSFTAFPTITLTGAVTGPWSIATADINNDGILDLVWSDYTSGKISAVLGNGNGTFGTQNTYAAGTNPRQIAIADVNGDGKPDVVVANSSSAFVSVLLGNGNGTFQTATSLATSGGDPYGVAVADLNGNGILDIAASTTSGDNVFLGTGSGSFQTAVALNAGAEFNGDTAIADMNGDGRPDIESISNAGSNADIFINQRQLPAPASNIFFYGNSTHNVEAVYAGGAIYPASTSNAVTLTATTAPDFTIASATTSQTIAPGQMGNYTILLTPQNSFRGTVALSCSGLPTGCACGFAPASLTLNTTKATSVMTISNPQSAAIASDDGGRETLAALADMRSFQQPAVWLLSGMAMLLLILTRQASARRYAVRFACVMIGFAAMGALQSCGTAPLTPPLSTTYTLTVTGTSGSLKHSTPVILTVKVAE
jgi:hypothetical protein